MNGVKERLGDLSWLGISDRAWVEVDTPDPVTDYKGIVDSQIEKILLDTAPMVAVDNVSMTKAKRQEWVDYRKKVQAIPLQVGYPTEVFWPSKPE